MLVRLIYVSRAAERIRPDEAEAIVEHSRNYNPEHGITGVLCYTGDTYLQVLEGGREEVNRLYVQITRDPRHRDATILSYEEIQERRFVGWTMGRVDLAKVNPAVLLKYNERPSFDPYRFTAQGCLSLLDELLSSAAVSIKAPTHGSTRHAAPRGG